MVNSMDPRGESDLSVRAAAAEAGDRLALVVDGRGWTWEVLAAAVAREAERLADVTTAGNDSIARVAFDAHPTVDTVVRLLALVEARICAVPLDPRLPAAVRAERVRLLAPSFDLDRNVAIDGPGSLQWSVRPRIDAVDTTPLAVLFTSGTTGAPRAVELSRSAFNASAVASAAHLGWEPDDRWLCCLPLAHVGGLSIVIRCLAARRAVVLAGGFDAPAISALLERDAVTLASFVPTMLHRLFEADAGWRAPASLRAVLLGGGPAGDELWDEVARRGVPARATYGMTETCAQVATARADAPRRLVPLDGVRLRVAGDQIEVAGPMLCTRVGGAPLDDQPWTPDGFLRTRDVGRVADGRLEVTGRVDGTIITGGQNVVPSAVEAVLATHPAVRRAAVFGVPDEEWGEIVGAVLEQTGAERRPTTDELRAWLASRLAPYERPRRVVWVRKLPENLSGKLDRPAARELWRLTGEVA